MDTNGQIQCFGYDAGNGNVTPPSGVFADFDFSGDHGCGIRSDGSVECWGANSRGEEPP